MILPNDKDVILQKLNRCDEEFQLQKAKWNGLGRTVEYSGKNIGKKWIVLVLSVKTLKPPLNVHW